MDLRGATTPYLIRPRFRANQRNRAASSNRMTRPMRVVGMLASSAAQRKMVRWSTWSMSATFSGVRYTGSAGRGSIPSAGAAIEVLLVEASVAVDVEIGLWVANLSSRVRRCRQLSERRLRGCRTGKWPTTGLVAHEGNAATKRQCSVTEEP